MEEELNSGAYMGIPDYVVFAGFMAGTLVTGTAAAWKVGVDSTDFLTGGRTMNAAAVTLSLLGGVVSAISVLGNATEIYMFGTQLWVNLLGSLWGTLIVIFLLLPVIYPLNLVSMNEFLQLRYDSWLLRKLGSVTQFVNSLLYMGICLYAPSITFSAVTNIPTNYTIIVMGLLCSIYISMGGARAVVYTDVLQTSVMFAGVLAVVLQVTISLGGVGEVWRIAEEGGRIEFFNLDPSPLVRHTFWSTQVLGMYFVVSVIGISQPQYQRLVSVKNLRTSQGLCVSFFVGLVALWSLFYYSGLCAYAAYRDCDPYTAGKVEKPDQVLAYLVVDKMKHLPGITGLFVASVAGAVLSSLSSQANGMVVILWEDFMSGWDVFAKMSEQTAKNTTRILSCVVGLMAIASAFLVQQLGTLFQAAYSISGALVSPLDGLFLTAVVAPWVNAKGAMAGFLSALCFNLWMIVGKIVLGAGQSERLSLSTDGCSNDALNMTDIFTTTTTTTTMASLDLEEPDSYRLAIYDISYCYSGSIGIIIVLLVSTLVSLCTGPVLPNEIDDALVDKRCLSVYRWIYSLAHPSPLQMPKNRSAAHLQEEGGGQIASKEIELNGLPNLGSD